MDNNALFVYRSSVPTEQGAQHTQTHQPLTHCAATPSVANSRSVPLSTRLPSPG